jgi:hypothetical protein
MFELLRPRAWYDALADAVAVDVPPRHPEVVLSDEAATWR